MYYLNEYKTFDNVQELNYHVKLHTNKRYYDMNETQRQVLQIIAQYSVKYVGACHLRIQTIADALGKSRRTIERSIRILIDLNVVDRLNTTRRVTGGKGANIYVVKPYIEKETEDESRAHDVSNMSHSVDREKSLQEKDTAPIVERESANLLSYSSNTEDNHGEPTSEQVIHSSIRNNTPEDIVNLLSPFFYGSELYRYIGIVFKAKHHPHIQTRIETHIGAFKACISDVMRRHKGGHIRSLEAYLYTSIRRLTRRLCLTE